ncbi:molybdate ABC transporter permease subunit [Leptothoe kymatousa]|uniref:Molybdate ABC transporter permease subunit n=1 Tax=Leptothoe kymatousa TAU-MAC 1615 TaxID=2364775 RepID=A0ABS5Y0X7_9CYAN|nr:molybdate ABC transporter permease subunit [Leptothoe kymatousa]MBT9311480.1 molybdate ABC transporter permease subunit [Leptothoe kymatousa TAU-MAC 1615]
MLDFSPLWISLRIAAIATIFTSFLGVAVAYFMYHYRGRWRSCLDSILLAPMVLPPTVLGFFLLMVLGKQGPLGQLLHSVNLGVVFTWYAAVITATVVALPLMYKTTLGAFEQIDRSLLQVARTLGANETSVFFRITLPLALPGLVAGMTLSFARALGEFGATLMLAGNIPGRTQTLPMAIYFAVERGDVREAALWSAVILTVALGGIVAVNRWSTQQNRRPRKQSAGPFIWSLPAPLDGQPLGDVSVRHRERQPPGINDKRPHQPVLEVALTKQLPHFTLNVEFSTTQQPLGLLGASGAGKSLLLRCLAGLETPDTGRIVLNGRVLFDAAQGIDVPICDRNIGILFQNYALFPHLTIAQNIAFGLPNHLTPRETTASVMQQLKAMHLATLANHYPHQLSGGQQQRIALARALANQPAMLLLDEPFAALDTHLRDHIEQQLTQQLQTFPGITLLVTHNLDEAYRICDRLLVLDQGSTIAHGPKQHIFEHPSTPRVAQLTGCKNLSPAMALNHRSVNAHHWQCHLQTQTPPPSNLQAIGIRSHHIEILTSTPDPTTGPNINTFPCWLTATSTLPHTMTLYLKLHTPPTHDQDYHLQAHVTESQWQLIKPQPAPWLVHLAPKRLLLFTEREAALHRQPQDVMSEH